MFSNDLAYFHDSTIPEALFGVPDPIFCVIREGLLSRKKIRITHLSANEEVEREIFPEVVFRCSDCWYLSAYCYLRQEARTFRLDRITKAELTGKKGKSHGIAEDFKKNGVPWLWEPEIKTPLPPSPEYEAKQKLRSISFNLGYCAERNDMESLTFQIIQTFRMSGKRLAFHLLNIKNHNIQTAACCNFGIQLTKGAGSRISGIGKKRFAIFFSSGIQGFKTFFRHIDFSAHF